MVVAQSKIGFDLHSGEPMDSRWQDCNIAVNPAIRLVLLDLQINRVLRVN